MNTGIDLIKKEREEQILKHGRTTELDIQTNKGKQLADAASILASPQIGTPRKRLSVMPSDWDDTISLKMCRCFNCCRTLKRRMIDAGIPPENYPIEIGFAENLHRYNELSELVPELNHS